MMSSRTRSSSRIGGVLAFVLLMMMVAAPLLSSHIQAATTPQPSKLTVPGVKIMPVRNLNGEAVLDNPFAYPCPLVAQRTVTCEVAGGTSCMESFEGKLRGRPSAWQSVG